MNSLFGIIFDMDGVLIDSEPSWQEAEIRILGDLGVPLNPTNVTTTTGWRIDRVVEHWRQRYPFPGDTAEIAHAITSEVARVVRQQGRGLPGAATLVSECRRQDLKVGLATSSSPTLIDAVLARLSLGKQFQAIASASEVPEGKPHPAVYRLCAQRLGLPPHKCLAIEDSLPGIRSAIAAGMTCIAVQEPRTTQGDALTAGAHRWVESLEQITPQNLKDLIQESGPPGSNGYPSK